VLFNNRDYNVDGFSACVQHVQRLLESGDWDIVLAVLRVLSVLATPRSTRQVIGESAFVSRLTTLSSTWNGLTDGGLNLATCSKESALEVRFHLFSENYGMLQTGSVDTCTQVG
jgi:hypothetical protein